MDIQAVDVRRIDDRDAPADCCTPDRLSQPFAFPGGDGLGIGNAGHVGVRPQDDGGRHDRPRQTAASHFIHTGDVTVAEPPSRVLERA